MSEHITHVAIFEDSYRLLRLHQDRFPIAFTHCLDQYYDHGIICSGSRGNHVHALPIVEQYRGRAPKAYSDETGAQLAGALGWISHRAADSTLNPLADQVDEEQNPMFNGQDLKRYYEVVVMREVYDSGKRSTASPLEPLSPATLTEDMRTNPAAAFVNIRSLETVLTNYYLREFLGLMSFTDAEAPDDLDAYLTQLVKHAQYFQEDLSLYTAAYEDPHPLKMQELVYHFNFYDPQDPLIRRVQQLRKGKPVSSADLDQALQLTESSCQYAQALKLNYDFWLALGAFYQGDIESPALREQLLM